MKAIIKLDKLKFRKLILPVAKQFTKFHPNTLTLIGFVIICISSLFYADGKFWVGGLILLIGGLFDVIDGEVAKLTGKASKFGAFLDSCIDRYEDFIILFGMFCWYIGSGYLATILILLAILGNYIVSYTRARAESLGYECKVGLGERAFRIPFIAIGSFFGPRIFIVFLVVLVIIANTTGIYRILWVWKKFKSSSV